VCGGIGQPEAAVPLVAEMTIDATTPASASSTNFFKALTLSISEKIKVRFSPRGLKRNGSRHLVTFAT